MARRRLSRALLASSIDYISMLPASALSSAVSVPSNMMLFSSPSQPLLSVHRRPRPKMSTESA